MGVAWYPALLMVPFYKSIGLKAWFVFARASKFPVTFVKKEREKGKIVLQPPLHNVHCRRFVPEIMLSHFIDLSWALIRLHITEDLLKLKASYVLTLVNVEVKISEYE
jgi:hypothetical protein